MQRIVLVFLLLFASNLKLFLFDDEANPSIDQDFPAEPEVASMMNSLETFVIPVFHWCPRPKRTRLFPSMLKS